MTPAGLKAARKQLGLTQAQLARLLDTDATSVRRMEMPPSASTARSLAPRVARLIRAYLAGYRPQDWPWPRLPSRACGSPPRRPFG